MDIDIIIRVFSENFTFLKSINKGRTTIIMVRDEAFYAVVKNTQMSVK